MRGSDPVFPFFPLQIPKVWRKLTPRKNFIYVVYTLQLVQNLFGESLEVWQTFHTFVAENNGQTPQTKKVKHKIQTS
jgi:hypothetical protein